MGLAVWFADAIACLLACLLVGEEEVESQERKIGDSTRLDVLLFYFFASFPSRSHY